MIKNTLFTLVIGFAVIWLISYGKFLTTASKYPVDYVFLIMGVVLAILTSFYTLRDLQRNSWHKSAVIYLVYYYGGLGLFSDGHQAGWSHSDGFVDKVLMAGVYMFVFLFSFFIPLILVAISMIQAYLLSIAVENRRI